MNKIFILSIVDLDNVGYQTKDVELFPNKETATERMRELYLEDCKHWGIKDPYDKDTLLYGFGDNYAYIFGESYYDIFEKEIGVVA